MKKIPTLALTMLIATLLLAVMPTERDAAIYEDTLRLHILANSDKREDQELKIAVRDHLLTKYGTQLNCTDSIDDAHEMVKDLLPDIEKSAEEFIKAQGYDYSVNATLGVEWYDTREYVDFSLPAGYYASLKVIIGDGDGQNWWCVMYPPMCMEMATESAPRDDGLIDYSREEIMLIKSGKYNLKFKILEELSRAFAKNG